jgi:hypothetical protein
VRAVACTQQRIAATYRAHTYEDSCSMFKTMSMRSHSFLNTISANNAYIECSTIAATSASQKATVIKHIAFCVS